MDPDELEAFSCAELVELIIGFFETNAAERDPDQLDDCVDWFLYAYSPETNFSSFQANEEAIKSEAFVEVILTKLKDLYQPEIFLEAVNLLSATSITPTTHVLTTSDGLESLLCEKAIVKYVLMMMGKDSANPRSQVLGCKIFSNLAKDNTNIRNFLAV